MDKPKKTITDTAPREQSGARTGELYDYQYQQAARECLSLLDEKVSACVLCEWHDDFVTEAPAPTRYRFHQVKTRKASLGPWSLNAFFGIKNKKGPKPKKGIKSPTLDKDSIAARLLEHYLNFGADCELLAFVTDNAIHAEFDSFLKSVASVKASVELEEGSRETFDTLHSAFLIKFKDLNKDDFFEFLKRIRIVEQAGSSIDLNVNYLLMAVKINELSEVDLTTSQAVSIGKSLVEKVRVRSHYTFPALPSSIEELRKEKGVIIDDVLALLSLSLSGYRTLKAGGPHAVKSLSRLQRLCKQSGVPDNLIADICRIKCNWDGWRLAERHRLDELDFIALKADCSLLMKQHSLGQLPFGKLATEAAAVAEKYASQLASSSPLTDELVMGFVFALAADSGNTP
ncbi:dsDNA nuclease domain-containing protein [Corallococcus sp. 4LFB]|uniref:dsDNA nuclease domain-containing protein n=1 Tax=Corallococcus sp. 4LFB TaxID=3383249 RepID=UPI003976A906